MQNGSACCKEVPPYEIVKYYQSTSNAHVKAHRISWCDGAWRCLQEIGKAQSLDGVRAAHGRFLDAAAQQCLLVPTRTWHLLQDAVLRILDLVLAFANLRRGLQVHSLSWYEASKHAGSDQHVDECGCCSNYCRDPSGQDGFLVPT